MIDKKTGILLAITSLSNAYPIGDIGPSAYEFIDYLKDNDRSFWQILPVGPLGRGNSPYESTSAFAGNPLLISPDSLVEQGLIEAPQMKPASKNGKVDYPKVKEFKNALLTEAFINFEKQKNHSSFDDYVQNESYWLDNHALFLVIQEVTTIKDWTQCEDDLKHRKPHAIEAIRKSYVKELRYHQFVQWQFALQWDAFRKYSEAHGIQLICDMPLFVSHQSPDVWAHPQFFKLDSQGQPVVHAGVPPDYFSETGQLWEMPVYNWDALKADHFKWWIERLKNSLQKTDILRLDHFIGFMRTYEVPASAKTAEHGHYHACPGDLLFKTVREQIGSLPFIADDLGKLTQEVEDLRDELEIPGTKVLQFEFEEYMSYPMNTVVYTSTHDNDTSIGWYESLTEWERQKVEKNINPDNLPFNQAMIKAALDCPSKIAIIPMQDILGLGSEARMNTPGVLKGNWEWRMNSSFA